MYYRFLIFMCFVLSSGTGYCGSIEDGFKFLVSNHTDRKTRNLESFRWMLSFDRGPGEPCETPFQCVIEARCKNGICACVSDFYVYVAPDNPKLQECRKKIAFGKSCYLSADCRADDPNTTCLERRCTCQVGAQYVNSHRLPPFRRRCYKMLESRDKECEIDEQCLHFADQNHRCRCAGVCVCYFIRFEQVGIGVVLFIFLFLVVRVTWRRRHYQLHTVEEQQHFEPRPIHRPDQRHANRSLSNLPPRDVNCQSNSLIASEQPFAVRQTENAAGLESCPQVQFLPYGATGAVVDGPPSYEEVVKNEFCESNDLPPPYQEVAEQNADPKIS